MADKINDLIAGLQKKLSLTSIAVTHDMVSANKIADRIAMLHQGTIIFCGTPGRSRTRPTSGCSSSSGARRTDA